MTSREVLSAATEELERAGCDSPRVDAEWLLAHVLGLSRTELAADGKHPLSPDDEQQFRELVARRARREPLAYVLGEWDFRRLTLQIDSRVLVPRPETETVVERCLALIADLVEPRVLDIGVGSGAIALAIAHEHPGSRVVGTDSSPDALAVAKENRSRTGLADRVELVHGALFAGLDGSFDLVVSNPPYVEVDELDGLEPEVAVHEPREALLASGATEAIAAEARSRLVPGAALVLETADGKAPSVAALLRRLGYEHISIGHDLNGRERYVDGRTPR
jgi:release factor glutamine methyltransferase